MEPVNFSVRCKVFGENQSQYKPLPAEVWKDGTVITCWGLTWMERFYILLKGNFFLSVTTFKQPLQPLRPSVELPEETRGY